MAKWRDARSRPWVIGTLVLLATTGTACRNNTAEFQTIVQTPRPAWVAGNERALQSALHLHASSNHNGRLRPGSVSWNAAMAQATGTEVVFWSEHLGIHVPFVWDLAIHKFAPTGDSLTFVNASAPPLGAGRLAPHVENASATADIGASGLRFRAVANRGTSGLVRYEVRERQGGLAQDIGLNRPLDSGCLLTLIARADSVDARHRLQVELLLAFHAPAQAVQHRIVFQFGTDSVGPRKIDDQTVLVVVPLASGAAQRLALDVTAAAALLPEGEDNTISRISFEAGVDASATQTVTIDSVRLESRDYSRENQYARAVAAARSVGTRFGLEGSFVAGEYSPRWPHMNGFTPEWAGDADLYARYPDWQSPREFADAVHARGGLVSLNHVLGLNDGAGQSVARELAVMDTILDNEAFGADILEVGYLLRAGASLEDYFAIWDGLRANRMPLCGDGVSDAHGGDWRNRAEVTNPVATWIWTTGSPSSAGNVIDALRRCRAYFGDFMRWRGEFDMRLGEAAMGSRLTTDADSLPLQTYVSSWPSDARLMLAQGTVRAVRIESLMTPVVPPRRIRPNERVWVRTRGDGFVRVVAYGADGSFLFAGNAIEYSGRP